MSKKVQTYLCIDVHAEMKDKDLQAGEPRVVEATIDEDHERITLREKEAKVHVEHPELHWHLLDRTKHGRATINSQHVKVEFYMHHDEYISAAALADMLSSEIETMGENLCEIDLKEEVKKCC